MMEFKAKCRLATVVAVSLWVGLAALYSLLRPVPGACTMTYMYPTYIPISAPANVSSEKYGLFLYHEGWKQIDFKEHLKKLNGVPVLFIPGNGGSYKQVRSLAAESSRAFLGGPLEHIFYKEASFTVEESRTGHNSVFTPPTQYNHMLDWFTVDLEEEHSAMDGRILEEHTEYVVHTIHRILDQYKESHEARSKEGAASSGILPTSVVLVGHSMGGFVARAVAVHPNLRRSSVETILTLSSPHQLPPVALQPSLGQLFSAVNEEWRKGYKPQFDHVGRFVSDPALSNVVVVSISGGIYDYQVRTTLTSLDGIVPSSNGFMISSTGTKNVWLSMDHQSILWCNQLVIQVSHTLLSLIDPEHGKPFISTQRRLLTLSKMLESAIPQSFDWNRDGLRSQLSLPTSVSEVKSHSSCPSHVRWPTEGLEKDLFIQSATVTVLAMDGRRRWLDIKKLGSNGRAHFAFVTNLAPCSGVRLHLWPEKSKSFPEEPAVNKIIEVTSKMIHIPAGPAPRQIEPGSQTEQPAPSALLWLTPEDMQGFRFLTISVAPRPTISGRPPPAASMAVGQFFHPKEGKREFIPWRHLRTSYISEDLFLHDNHPLALNISFDIGLGLLPTTLSVQTAGCGIRSSLALDQAGDTKNSGLCKLRCFPPVALAWDPASGFYVVPNLYSETLVVDSSPLFWNSYGKSDRTSLLLLVDPHCSYKVTASVSFTASAGRLFLSYPSQIAGFLVAVLFFALMRQSHAWELGLPLPCILSAVEMNLRMPIPFSLLVILPLFISIGASLIQAVPLPVGSFFTISVICYLIANGSAIILIFFSRLVLYAAASIHVFMRMRWQSWQENMCVIFLQKIFSLSSILYSFKVIRILRGNPNLVVSFVSIPLVCFIHPACGLLVLLLFHAYCCHTALCSFLATSFRSHAQRKTLSISGSNDDQSGKGFDYNDTFGKILSPDENQSGSPSSAKSFYEAQIEIFNYRHGVLVLHLVSTLMFAPSLVAWLQRFGTSHSFPWFIDAAVCVGIILHGICGWKPDVSALKLPLPILGSAKCNLSLVYLLSGYFSFISALSFVPYRTFYAMATVGIISFLSRCIDWRNGERSESYFSNRRKHSHHH